MSTLFTLDALRLFIHVTAASIWVGGQFALAGLVGTVRELDPEGPRLAARAFNRMAWPAYGVLVITGLWNILAVPLDAIPHPEIEIKILVVALSGIGAALHQNARGNKVLLAVGGAMSALFGAAAIWVGVVMAQFV
ncbi:MAG: hypothetical protein H6517_01970 [Microthrixaceae bacterium]|nr:hypothetical protein [Microthrixaceae bacterium]MCB1011646.1 hypothetical protein [Microthrixaceae bacterium]MCB9386576.1 hypothetical protein [Microthrixaceae bacterium]MCO5320055.1 hypothetical protein [Microthrixaceae bacterium]